MCGIVAYVGERDASEVLIEGLRRLEYRGYDSAGIAVQSGSRLELRKRQGKLSNLTLALRENPVQGNLGIGHTRWATHGRPSDLNAHPHTDCREQIAVIHNGIIENYLLLRRELEAQGHTFRSQTDSEVIAHLVEKYFTGDLSAAVYRAVGELQGAYAIVVIAAGTEQVVAVRTVSPLVVGLGEGENFLASDVPALLPYTRRVIFLADGQVAVLDRHQVRITNLRGRPVEVKPSTVDWNPVMAEKGGFDHFMLKEIYEQPQVIQQTLGGRLIDQSGDVDLGLGLDFSQVQRVHLVACGSAFYASCVGKYVLERFARLPVEVDLASEYRYRDPVVPEGTLAVAVSQSGETIDTLEALREARRRGAKTLGLVNVKGSSITREVDDTLYLHAGPEIGVASTKAYTGMLCALVLLGLHLGRQRGTIDQKQASWLIAELRRLSGLVQQVLDHAEAVNELGRRFQNARDFLFLGRGINFPTALEGALKLKEISYIHAEAYATGEMKHGPIALIDANMPVVMVATESAVYDKVISNLQEVKAREGIVLALVSEGDTRAAALADAVIQVPRVSELLSPIVNVVPLQLLAYDIAKRRGLDVDQPRNLAKAVTVE
ncbi:MAG: glutamine--fructose-6-phosphate transaminase (isomerizing) [Deinococcus sp.]|nr:glutamine--fructose-6-phosphate transaminase (isomerizing) [Deinococcus sp.]